MPEHINTTVLVIGLAIAFAFRFVALMGFLLMMMKFQKMEFTWLPLIGATLLASALDMIPLVGHFIAVPVLYLCIWKITKSSLYPDAAFTVGLSYALVRCLSLIMLAYLPFGLPTHSAAKDSYGTDTNFQVVAEMQPASENTQPNSTVADEASGDKPAVRISVKGVIRGANDPMVTIQCGQKNYTISQDEGATVATDSGTMAVRFVALDKNSVTLSVGGQDVKYPVN